MTISNFKKVMTAKVIKKGGVWENFGQKELAKLKDRVGYNPYGTEKERQTAKEIQSLNEWAMGFTGR